MCLLSLKEQRWGIRRMMTWDSGSLCAPLAYGRGLLGLTQLAFLLVLLDQ